MLVLICASGSPHTLPKEVWSGPISLKLSTETSNQHHRDTCTSLCTAALFTLAECSDWLQCPSTEEIEKENGGYSHSGFFIFIFFRSKEQNYVLVKVFGTTGGNHIKKIKSALQRQISCVFSHLWFLGLGQIYKIMYALLPESRSKIYKIIYAYMSQKQK